AVADRRGGDAQVLETRRDPVLVAGRGPGGDRIVQGTGTGIGPQVGLHEAREGVPLLRRLDGDGDPFLATGAAEGVVHEIAGNAVTGRTRLFLVLDGGKDEPADQRHGRLDLRDLDILSPARPLALVQRGDDRRGAIV